jgi:hypothetical protein
MAYCTAAEVVLESGSELDAITIITPLIVQSDKMIDEALLVEGITGIEGNDSLNIASIHFTIAKIITRDRLTLARPNSLSVPALSFGNNTQNEINYHEQTARDALKKFIDQTLTGGSRISVVKTEPS